MTATVAGLTMPQIYQGYFNTAKGIAQHVLHNEVLAEDAAQLTMVKVWKNAKAYNNDKGAFFTWLYNIAKRTALDVLKAENGSDNNKRYKVEVDESIFNLKAYSINTDVIGLQEHINNLKPELAWVIRFHYLRGMSHQEIHEETAIPLGTIKSRIKKAVSELRLLYN
jgi:RNA polymerase sigma-70 factor (ECF subfamily)